MNEDRFIPYAHQWIEEDDIAAVAEVLRSDWLTCGPKVAEFERSFASYVGASYAVAVSSGTAALHAAAFAAGIGPGDEVITTPLTFAATANCALYRGGIPVFADIDPRTYNIDPQSIEPRITARTRAIIPVHFAGQPCDLEAIHRLAQRHGLTVIEDAAHALGATYDGRRIGGLSDLTIFSFHPVKQITTGEGGMVTTNAQELYDKLLMFRSHGLTRDAGKWRHPSEPSPWYYEVQFLGYNYRLTDIQAALGISQLKKADRFLARRRVIVSQYNEAFADLPVIITPVEAAKAQSAWHLYVIQLAENAPDSRDKLCRHLKDSGIAANLHYIPLYRHPLYAGLSTRHQAPPGQSPDRRWLQEYPETERYYRRALTLPLFPAMTDADVSRVVEAVEKFF
ncbi:MAG: UDP-4-amino-4,6-dideoxy-N-acetyl-beta-L-altrosamine transaminase [Thermacetogeniaceae bacterium]